MNVEFKDRTVEKLEFLLKLRDFLSSEKIKLSIGISFDGSRPYLSLLHEEDEGKLDKFENDNSNIRSLPVDFDTDVSLQKHLENLNLEEKLTYYESGPNS